MSYKLVAIDMDGTLLNRNNEISETNKNILKVITEMGIQVVISTGRLFTSARYYAKKLGLITPIIACNGAYVCEYHRNNVLYERPLKTMDIKNVIELLENNNMYYHFYDNENFYTKELKYNSLKYYNWNKKQKKGDKINIEVLKNPLEFIIDEKPTVYKIVVMDKNSDKLNYISKKLINNRNIEVVSSMTKSFDIMDKGVSKGETLRELCKIFSINSDEVIAIGDNHNDISMIKYAKTGIAMGNGEKEVKEMADIVTDTNDNDGVGKALKELIL